jgi:hypothetical protein
VTAPLRVRRRRDENEPDGRRHSDEPREDGDHPEDDGVHIDVLA